MAGPAEQQLPLPLEEAEATPKHEALAQNEQASVASPADAGEEPLSKRPRKGKKA